MVDLIDAKTISTGLAAYSLAAIQDGASFLVGAVPGGAGKTTVMGALLNFVPPEVPLAPADSLDAIERGAGWPRSCFICHEISPGPYYAYLWAEELRAYFDLQNAGHMLATNLHADTCEQARDQICDDNGVDERALQRMNLMFFLSLGGDGPARHRRIAEVWESDGQSPHRRVFGRGAAPDFASSRLVSPGNIKKARERIGHLQAAGVRKIEDIRALIVNSHPSG